MTASRPWPFVRAPCYLLLVPERNTLLLPACSCCPFLGMPLLQTKTLLLWPGSFRPSGSAIESQFLSFLPLHSFYHISSMFSFIIRQMHGHLQAHLKPAYSPFSETLSEAGNNASSHFSDTIKLAEILDFPKLLSPQNFNIWFH